MSHKNKLKIAAAAVCLALLAGIGIWLLLPKSYEDMVPEQAKAVLRISPSSEMLKASAAKLKEWTGLEPKGIDANQAAYLFITPNEYVALAAALNDADAFGQGVEDMQKRHLATILPESDGLHWAWMEKGWLMAWNKRALLVLGPGVAKERDQLRQTLVQMAEGNAPFTSTPAYEQLLKQPGEAQLYAQVDAVPAPYNALFRLNIPADAPLDAVQVFASLRMEKARTVVSFSLTSDNEDIKQQLTQYEQQKGCISISPDAQQSMPLFFMATRTGGMDLVALLQSDATLRGLLMGLNQVVDATRMLGTSNGLLTLQITDFDADWQPTFSLQAENQTQGLLSDANYWMESARKQHGVTLKQLSSTAYQLTNEKQSVCIGLHGQGAGQRVFFSSPSLMHAGESGIAFASKTATHDGTTAYFHIRMDQLRAQPCMKGDNAAATLVTTLLPASKSFTYEAKTGCKGTITIE